MAGFLENFIESFLKSAADYIATPAKGDPKMVFPPKDVCRYVLSALQWSFPRLMGITTIPVRSAWKGNSRKSISSILHNPTPIRAEKRLFLCPST